MRLLKTGEYFPLETKKTVAFLAKQKQKFYREVFRMLFIITGRKLKKIIKILMMWQRVWVPSMADMHFQLGSDYTLSDLFAIKFSKIIWEYNWNRLEIQALSGQKVGQQLKKKFSFGTHFFKLGVLLKLSFFLKI